MSARTTIGSVGLAVLAALTLAACGGASSGSGVSTLNPAAAAPAASLAYGAITVRPQGAEADQIASTVNKLAGKDVISKLPHAVDKLLSSGTGPHVTYQQMKPWLGAKVGVDLIEPAGGQITADTAQNVVVIFPTDDPSAAGTWARNTLRHQRSGSRSVSRVVGHFLLVGGSPAVSAAAAAVRSGRTLAASSTYSSDSAALASNAVMTGWINLHRLLPILAPKIRAQSGGAAALKQLHHEFGPTASAALGLALTPHEIRMDLIRGGQTRPAGRPSNVGSLPANSWLAVNDSSISSEASLRKVQSGFDQLMGMIVARQRMTYGSAIGGVSIDSAYSAAVAPTSAILLLETHLIPALGPLSLSASGTSPLDLQAGIALNSVNKHAQARLLTALAGYARDELGPSRVTGTAHGFAIASVLPGAATVTRQSGRLVATYGYANAQAFLHPSSTLADNALYKQALAALPAGTRSVPLYLNFNDIATLASIDHNPKDAATMRVVKLLNYAIVGGTADDVRIVIGLH